MDILQRDYPDEQHVLLYDNATTHTKRPANALSATKMTLGTSDKLRFTVDNPDGTEDHDVKMEDGFFADGSPQHLYHPDGHPQAGLFKGMRTLITERRAHGHNLPDPTRLKAQCAKFHCAKGATTCCCRRVLYSEPDFQGGKSVLERHCEARGFRVIFYPKFHCELNFIEQVWGFAKRLYREYPASSLEDDLERNTLNAVDSVPLDSIRR
jgi:hypothetical protein